MSTGRTAKAALAAQAGTVNPEIVEQASPDRKTQIICAAERLFARYGYHAVTLRQIADEAGVPLALIRYYYGAKNELFLAIFERWSHKVDERMAQLRAVDIRPGDAGSLRRIVEAFALPVLALLDSEEGENYVLLISRELSHPTEEVELAVNTYFDHMTKAFIGALQAVAPNASREQVAGAYQSMLGVLMSHLGEVRRGRVRRLSGARQGSAAEAGAMLVAFIVAGMRAVLPVSAGAASRSPSREKAVRK